LIALTFDDGPNEPYTRQILDVLGEYGAKATFFVIGKWARKCSDGLLVTVQGSGHLIGNHTDSHPPLDSVSDADASIELRKCQATIEYFCWAKPDVYFRPPFGKHSEYTEKQCREWGWKSVLWDIHGGDWAADSVEAITEPIFAYLDAHKSGIVLLHDGYYKEFGADRSKTVEATRRILERYKGEKFVTIGEYMQ